MNRKGFPIRGLRDASMVAHPFPVSEDLPPAVSRGTCGDSWGSPMFFRKPGIITARRKRGDTVGSRVRLWGAAGCRCGTVGEQEISSRTTDISHSILANKAKKKAILHEARSNAESV